MSNNKVLPIIITANVLRKIGICKDAIPKFLKVFPSGEAELTEKNLLKAAEADLDIDYFAIRFLLPNQRAAYWAATEPAWEAYLEATAPAWEAYWEETAPAWADFQKAAAPAWADFQKATAKALWQIISSDKKEA